MDFSANSTLVDLLTLASPIQIWGGKEDTADIIQKDPEFVAFFLFCKKELKSITSAQFAPRAHVEEEEKMGGAHRYPELSTSRILRPVL